MKTQTEHTGPIAHVSAEMADAFGMRDLPNVVVEPKMTTEKFWYQGVTNDHGQQALLAGPFQTSGLSDQWTAAVDNLLESYSGAHWWKRWTASFAADKGCGKLNLKLGLDSDEKSLS